MRRLNRAAFLVILSVLFATVAFAPGVASAHGRIICRGIPGTFTWTRTSTGYSITLDLPFQASLPKYCNGGVPEDSTFDDPPGPGIDGFFGTLTGTVDHLGKCDDRPTQDPLAQNAIQGVDMQGRIFMYNTALRRVHAHDLRLIQDRASGTILLQNFDPNPVFPSASPTNGYLLLDGGVPGGFNAFINTGWAMTTRVYGNCAPGGDPKAKLDMFILPPF